MSTASARSFISEGEVRGASPPLKALWQQEQEWEEVACAEDVLRSRSSPRGSAFAGTEMKWIQKEKKIRKARGSRSGDGRMSQGCSPGLIWIQGHLDEVLIVRCPERPAPLLTLCLSTVWVPSRSLAAIILFFHVPPNLPGPCDELHLRGDVCVQ